MEGHRFKPQFLWGEWADVVDAWQLGTWEAYRDVARLGRRTRVGGKQREVLWSIFARVRAELAKRKAVTWAELLGRVTDRLVQAGKRPFRFVVVDEAQDVGIAELRFLAALGGARPDGLFFAGDIGQRIFQQPSHGDSRIKSGGAGCQPWTPLVRGRLIRFARASAPARRRPPPAVGC